MTHTTTHRWKPQPRQPRMRLSGALLCAFFALALPWAGLSAAAQTGSGGSDIEGVHSIEVLPGWKTPEGRRLTGLRIRLKPGWKTYWRAPGDAGIPPQFDWTGSRNIKAVKIHWPRPEVAVSGGMRSIVYSNEVVLPLEFTPESPDRPIIMKARVGLGVCRDICIPVSVAFEVDLSPTDTRPDPAIRKALAERPVAAQQAGVRRVICEVAPIRDGLKVTTRIHMPAIGQEEIAVIEAPDPSIWVSEAQTRREGQTLIASAEMVPPSNAPFALDRSGVRITVLGDGTAVDIQGCTGS